MRSPCRSIPIDSTACRSSTCVTRRTAAGTCRARARVRRLRDAEAPPAGAAEAAVVEAATTRRRMGRQRRCWLTGTTAPAPGRSRTPCTRIATPASRRMAGGLCFRRTLSCGPIRLCVPCATKSPNWARTPNARRPLAGDSSPSCT
jgi:hypothetical protein